MNRYGQAYLTSLAHGLATFLRRRRTHVVSAMIILPALLPLLIPFLPRNADRELSGDWILTQMIEIFYITGVTPLLALFFAAMLVGEDVESQTISYLLTRPLPRSAWVLGRFSAYLVLCSGLILVSILTLRTTLLAIPASTVFEIDVWMLLHYEGVAVASLLAYGALCAFLGALLRHPVIVGALLIFGVQHMALLAPGITDFLTIQKYISTLLPGGGRNAVALAEVTLEEFLAPGIPIEIATALITLGVFSAACLVLAGLTVRRREYTTPVAVTE